MDNSKLAKHLNPQLMDMDREVNIIWTIKISQVAMADMARVNSKLAHHMELLDSRYSVGMVEDVAAAEDAVADEWTIIWAQSLSRPQRLKHTSTHGVINSKRNQNIHMKLWALSQKVWGWILTVPFRDSKELIHIEPLKVTYKCTINVPGYPSSCKEAKSKKDAQTLAAWDFSETLVSMGKIGRGDLPHKPECVGMFIILKYGKLCYYWISILVKTTESANTQESKIGLLKPEDENKPEYGGWTSENARQRLNRFCMAERISCDFQNYSEGPCHSKVFFHN